MFCFARLNSLQSQAKFYFPILKKNPTFNLHPKLNKIPSKMCIEKNF